MMSHSFARRVDLTCSRCGQTFNTDVWLIVAVAERLDLLDRIRSGTVHDLPCPHCGHEGEADAPLLLYRPGQDPPLLFSPAQGTTAEQDREQAAALLSRLRESLGDTWRDEWVGQMPVIPRQLLPAALTGGVEAALRQAAEAAQEALEELRQQDPETYRRLEEAARRAMESAPLLPALQQFIQAGTWSESRRIVERHPELLSDEADVVLEQLAAAAREQGDENAVRLLEEHRALLQRCREVGVPQAFAEKIGVSPDELAAFRDDLRRAQEGKQRYLRGGDQGALDSAVAARERILSHPTFPASDQRFQLIVMNDAGGVFLRRYWARGRLSDLNRALDLWERAVALTSEGSPDLPGCLNNLALGLSARYGRTEELADLAAAVAHWERAVALTAEGSPDLPSRLNNLASGLSARYGRTGELADLAAAVAHWERATTRGLEVALEEGLRSARNWGHSAFERGTWVEAVRAYDYGRRAMDLLLQTQLLRSEKEAWLPAAQGLPVNHAFALARTGDPPGAVETLEAGRARLLAEALERNRRDLERLPALGHADLYERYRTAAGRREALLQQMEGARLVEPARQAEAAPREVLRAELKAVNQELEDIIADIRRVPDYQDFLLSPTFEHVARAAQDVPLVYLVTTPAGGLALIVRQTSEVSETSEVSGSVEAVWLDFSADDLDALLVRREGENVIGGYLPGQLFVTEWLVESLDEALPLLGERLMAPVAARLRVLGATAAVLIPAGHLALLPLHAARYPVDGRQVHFLDEFDVSYAPSARALAAARREAQARRAGPLHLTGVGNPLPHPKALAYARAELEEVAAFFAGETHPLYEETATKAALLKALPGASHVHLACHGRFDLEDPLKSHVQLANREPLTLREIMEEEVFATAQLVALSACQSAITEFRRLPDEVIGLPTGLVQAGVPGVVGTLWPVEDLSTALVMVRFYEYHLRGEPATGEGPMPPARALRRAQRWLREVTAGELLDYFQRHKALHEARRRAERKRMPEAVAAEGVIRFALEDADARPFADSPYHWAPFIFVGV